jgi:hypothetical protein
MAQKIVFPPIIAPLIANKQSCWLISGFLIIHFTLVFFGLPSWPCPIRWGLNIPCPGCGLSRAIKALAQGNWQLALTIHLFAPVVLIGLLLIVGASFFSSAYRLSLAHQLQKFEQQTGIIVILLLGSTLYWLIRLLFFPEILDRFVM